MSALNHRLRSNPPFPDAGQPVPLAYLLTDLGELPDRTPLLPVALNDLGDVAMHAHTQPDEPESWKVHSHLLQQGRRSQRGLPPGRSPLAGLNDNGLLCGAVRRGGASVHAWASHLGWFGADLWPAHDSVATGINATGAVTGHVVAPGEDGWARKRTFLVNAQGQSRLLLPPWGHDAVGAAINDAGAVLINTTTTRAGPGRGTQTWLWGDGSFQLAENIGGDTWGVALTPAGRMAGHGLTPLGERHAIFWCQGRTYDLNPSGEWESEALAANDQCIVVGRLLDPRGECRAFRWTPGDGLRPLSEFVAYAEDWVLQKATAINARGQIAGTGLLDGRRRGFLLTPAE